MMDFKVEIEDVHQLQLEEYICRTTPCVVLGPKTPSSFAVRILSKDVENLRTKFEQEIAIIYKPFLGSEPSDDPEIRDMQDYLSEANESLTLDGIPAANIFHQIKDIIGDYGVICLQTQFYRVLILSWCEDKQLCSVFLIDEGSYEFVAANEILPMSHLLKKYPYFSIICHLYRLAPPGDEPDWTVFSKTFFQNFLKSKNVWLLYVLPPIENAITTPVQLIWAGETKKESVSDVLVRFSAAVLTLTDNFGSLNNSDFTFVESPKDLGDKKELNILNTSKVESSDDVKDEEKLELFKRAEVKHDEFEDLEIWDPRDADFASYRNHYDIDVDNPGVAIYGYAGKDDSVICSQFGKEGFCYKGDSCRKQHIQVDSNKVTNLPQLIYIKATTELPNIYINHTYRVHCFCIEKNINVVLLEDINIFKQSLKEMTIKLNDPKNVAKMKTLSMPPGLGELVALQDDGLWTRARCIDSDPFLDEYTLQLVDIGSIVRATQKQLRTLELEFLRVPFMSREVLLHGFQITSKPKNNAVLSEKLKDYSKWSLKVVGQCDFPVVKIITEDNISLGEILVDNGLAVFYNRLIPHPESTYIPG